MSLLVCHLKKTIYQKIIFLTKNAIVWIDFNAKDNFLIRWFCIFLCSCILWVAEIHKSICNDFRTERGGKEAVKLEKCCICELSVSIELRFASTSTAICKKRLSIKLRLRDDALLVEILYCTVNVCEGHWQFLPSYNLFAHNFEMTV